jgi:hypothetical protein
MLKGTQIHVLSSVKISYDYCTVIVFQDIIHHSVFILNTQNFGDWISSLGKTFSVGPNR